MDFHWRHGFASLHERMRQSMLLTHLFLVWLTGEMPNGRFITSVANRGSFSEC